MRFSVPFLSPVSSLKSLSQRSLGSVLLLSQLAACAALGPDYQRPELAKSELPAQWSSRAEVSERSTPPETVALWWRDLSDPVLDYLVEQALQSSPTLEIALARLNQSRAALGQANAAASPSVSATGGALTSSGAPKNQAWATTTASWELDLFGSVRRGQEGAVARAAADVALLKFARISLAADVADAYLNYRGCQSYMALSDEDVASREATARLMEANVTEGFTAPYQAVRSKASVAEAKTQLAATRAQCDRLANQITQLSGVLRPELERRLGSQPTGLERLPEPKEFSIAVPQTVIQQRPDLQAAERTLAAASADIGLAEADRYLRFSLSGDLSYTTAASKGNGLLSFGTLSFGPTISLPLFDGGKRKAAVSLSKARYEEALAQYKDKVRKAVQEIEDGLTRYAAAHERAENAYLSATQYERYFDSVEVRFREGASNLLELEDARRAMLNAQQTLLNVQQERLQAWVALHRATGGQSSHPVNREPVATSHPVDLNPQ